MSDDIQSAALARLFSASVLKEMAARGRSPALARLLRECGLQIDPTSSDHVGSFYDRAFSHLKKKADRYEYIYKSALTQKVLMGTHSLNTASMITEMRVGNCKADVVILNGTGTVYEIKSERDSLSRLVSQVNAYSNVFASINVILGENHLKAARTMLPEYVGIMVLSDRYQVSTERSATDEPARTNAAAIFDTINQKEAMLILRELGKEIPDVPNTQRYLVLRELFSDLESETAHRKMVDVLKVTRNLRSLKELIEQVPEALHAASLSMNFRRRDWDKFVCALNTPIQDALRWG